MDLSCEIFDDYEHLDNDLEYILENVLSENIKKNFNNNDECKKLYDLYNTLLLNRCECIEELSQQECLQCDHLGNYVFDVNFQELVLKDIGNVPDLIYECSHMCTCDPKKCLNRLVQYGPRKYLQIVNSPKYGSKGLITTNDIPKGAFICEYAGELLTKEEAKNILKQNEIENNMNYVLFLKESCLTVQKHSGTNDNTEILTIVNPSRKGNIGRYLNHSCEPNCRIVSVRIDCPIPKIAFFSNCYIKAGEEICFNYNEGVKQFQSRNIGISKRIACLCHSKQCAKYLPNSEYET
ncbi:putative histone-lysine N-methyltransferase set-23 [Cochliomyia hominivorax]